jgi:DNA-directed RNA polymerase subunit L
MQDANFLKLNKRPAQVYRMIKVKNIEEKTIKYGQEMQKGKFVESWIRLEIHGADVAYINGIRGSLFEVGAKALKCEESSIKCSDRFILRDMLATRIMQLAISQDVKSSQLFNLKVQNQTDATIYVMSDDIKPIGGGKSPLESGTPIVDLQPGEMIEIKNIFITTGTACDNAAFMLFSGIPVVAPVGIEPFNAYTGKGVKSSEVDCLTNSLHFATNGNIGAAELLAAACESLREKIATVEEYAQISTLGNTHRITLIGETYTVANILALELSAPYVSHVSAYSISNTKPRKWEISISVTEDVNPAGILASARDAALKKLGAIIAQI